MLDHVPDTHESHRNQPTFQNRQWATQVFEGRSVEQSTCVEVSLATHLCPSREYAEGQQRQTGVHDPDAKVLFGVAREFEGQFDGLFVERVLLAGWPRRSGGSASISPGPLDSTASSISVDERIPADAGQVNRHMVSSSPSALPSRNVAQLTAWAASPDYCRSSCRWSSAADRQ